MALGLSQPCWVHVPRSPLLQVPEPRQYVSIADFGGARCSERTYCGGDISLLWVIIYLRPVPPRLCISLLRDDHVVIVPAVLSQVVQHKKST